MPHKKEQDLKQKISLKNTKGTATNPFMIELKGKMFLQPRANTIIAKGESIVNVETGEVIDESILIGRRKIVDKSQFAKIYASEIGLLYELSKTAQNVFLHLIKVMDYENKAFFMYTTGFKEIGYKTHKPALIGILELIARKIIHPAIMPHWYWLNPAIVCKGERFAMYTEFVTEEYGQKSESKLRQQQAIKGHQLINAYPEEVKNKLEQAANCPSTTSEGKKLYQTNIFGGKDEINPYTGEIEKN